ncbi:MAG: CapA family protein [Candidatus Adiutrix sp.]|nr:CapA family protein [Candidatus Adiutrix sp.]
MLLFLIPLLAVTFSLGPVGPAGAEGGRDAADSSGLRRSAPPGRPAARRAGKSAARIIRLAAVGDLMPGQAALTPGSDGAAVFREVKPFLADRQIVFGNLEGPLTDRGAPTKDTSEAAAGRYYVFRSPPACGRLLLEAGFNLLSLANNHINDYGRAGRDQTRAILDELGIAHAGAPGEVAELKVNKTRLAFIALAPNAGCQNLNDLPGAVALVEAEAKKPGTLVIVSFHGGGEGAGFMSRPAARTEKYLGENRGNLPHLAHTLIDAGADLVLGHGPHVPRGLELYHGRLIAWSLGNFATLSGISVSGPAGLAPLLLVDLEPDGAVRALRVVSFKQTSRRGPRLDPSHQAAKVMAELSRGDLPEELRAALTGEAAAPADRGP